MTTQQDGELVIRQDYLPFGKPNFSDEEIAAVTRVLRSGWVGMGAETIAFEKELAQFFSVPHVVTVNSCTSGLILSLLVNGVGPGDEVICPSMTFCSTANAALFLGAKPVLCDVDRGTLSVTPESVRAKLTLKTKAVIVVHFGGYAVDVEKIRAILPDSVAIVEDAAHALGSRYSNGKMVGASGNLACFSFYANKNLATGDGGAIALFDEAQAERLRSLRQNGMPADAWKRYTDSKSMLYSQLTELGYKMNLIDLEACIGRVQLKRQPEFRARRLAIAQRYVEGLSDIRPAIGMQADCLSPAHARHLFIIQLPIEAMRLSRDEFLLEMRARNIGVSIHYAPLHQMPLYGFSPDDRLPNTDWLSQRIVTLPISASMTLDDTNYVIAHIKEYLK